MLHKQKKTGKLEVKALGPYTFIEYHGELHVTATIADHKGRKKHCSVANLVPLNTIHAPAKLIKISSQPKPFGLTPEPIEIDTDTSSSDSDSGSDISTPVGVRIKKRPRNQDWDRDIWPSSDDGG